MAMFGTLKKPNPFGVDQAGQSIVAGDEPPVDMGDFTPAPPAKNGGFLADGSRGQAALGAFLDSIATQAGGQASFAPIMKQRQDRADALADWQAKFAFQQANKAPDYGEFGNALIQAGIKPGSPEWTKAFADKTENTINPVISGVLGGNSYIGRQKWVQDQFERGGGQAVSPQPGAASSPPAYMPSGSPTSPNLGRMPSPRPAGMSDSDLMSQAKEAIMGGADANAVFGRLRDWGVKP